MKHYLYTLLTAALLAVGTFGSASAKRVVAPEMYMFGFAASFADTIVCFTDIQRVDSAWIEKKSKFLQSRDMYAYQLRTFLSQTKQLPNRTCVVFYHKNRAKLEKKYVKMRRLYTTNRKGRQHFDVRFLDAGEFKFKSINLSELEKMEREEANSEKKGKKKSSKK